MYMFCLIFWMEKPVILTVRVSGICHALYFGLKNGFLQLPEPQVHVVANVLREKLNTYNRPGLFLLYFC